MNDHTGIDAMVAFLEERLNEEAFGASLATMSLLNGAGIWRWGGALDNAGAVDETSVVMMDDLGQPARVAAEANGPYEVALHVARHIAQHCPARVLQDTDTTRDLLERWRREFHRTEGKLQLLRGLLAAPRETPTDHTWTEQTRAHLHEARGRMDALTYALALVASRYATHPDWTEQWCPERAMPRRARCSCHPSPE